MKRNLLTLIITVVMVTVSSRATSTETATTFSTPTTSAPASTENSTQPPLKSVKRGLYETKIVKVEWTQTRTIKGIFMGKADPDEVFLVVHLKTNDPCFDEDKNGSCFESTMTPEQKVMKACGKVRVAPDKEKNAGLAGGSDIRICSYNIPKKATSVMLRLTGYPEIKLERGAPGIARLSRTTNSVPQKQGMADSEVSALIEKGKEKVNPEVLALTEKGKESLKAGKYDDSMRLLNEAYAKARSLKDSMGEVITLQALASLFAKVGEPQQMLRCYSQALAICKAREEKLFEATILLNMGEVYRQIGQPQEALEHYQQSLKVYETIDGELGKFGAAYAKGLIEFIKHEIK